MVIHNRFNSILLRLFYCIGVLATPLIGHAASKPFTVSETYIERSDLSGNASKTPSGCSVQFSEIGDTRRSKDMLGMMMGKPVHGPSNSIAWLQSALGGLQVRGVKPIFVSDSVQPTAAIKAQTSLSLFWISASMNMVANVVVHLHAHRNGLPDIDSDFRGTQSQMNWAGANGEIQETVDKAYGKLLDQIAPELLKLCAAP